jgi:hypothetical protein
MAFFRIAPSTALFRSQRVRGKHARSVTQARGVAHSRTEIAAVILSGAPQDRMT